MEHLTDEEITAVAALLSGERLGTFQAMAGNTRAAVALHQELLQLAGALMSVTAVVEIALRNAVCDKLTEYFGVEGWLRRPPAPFAWKDEERGKIEVAVRSAQRASYAKLNSSEKRARDEVACRRGCVTSSDSTRGKKQSPFEAGRSSLNSRCTSGSGCFPATTNRPYGDPRSSAFSRTSGLIGRR
jgi:hypothetical protein